MPHYSGIKLLCFIAVHNWKKKKKKRKPVATRSENIVFEAPKGVILKFTFFHRKNTEYIDDNFDKFVSHELMEKYSLRNTKGFRFCT